jgi:hypothetical protein
MRRAASPVTRSLRPGYNPVPEIMRAHPPRRRFLSALLLALPLCVPAEARTEDASDVRILLEDGRTEKAARLAEDLLEQAGPAAAPELRYLRFKAYVLDLSPGHEDLFRKLTKGEDEPMEVYETHLDELEEAVRSEGAAALGVLVDGLAAGDSLDRLLILGILRDMAPSDLDWLAPAGTAGASPVAAARGATLGALEDCALREDETGGKPPYALEDQREREPFVETLYAADSGLEFLAVVDADAWAEAAAFALECRTLAGEVLADRARLREYGAKLRGPLRERLEASGRPAARLEAVEWLGRLGTCDDLAPLRSAAGREEALAEAVAKSVDRIVRRQGCPD